METWRTRLTASILVFSLFPGAFEAVENLAHLVTEGHPAHLALSSAPAPDHEEPEGDEHGCTTVFHLCSCHASLSSVCPSRQPAMHLADAMFRAERRPSLPRPGFILPLDRPPQT